MNPFARFAAQHAALLNNRQTVDAGRRARHRQASDIERKALAHIRDHGRQNVRQIAAALGVRPPELYATLQRLKTLNQIEPKGAEGGCNFWSAL